MVIKEVELLFQANALDVPVIKQQDQGGGWTVTLSGTHQLNPLHETARGQVRVFKRLCPRLLLVFPTRPVNKDFKEKSTQGVLIGYQQLTRTASLKMFQISSQLCEVFDCTNKQLEKSGKRN